MDANESALNQYQSELCASDRADDWKEGYIDVLLHESGEYYPFKPANFQEAIAEMDLGACILMSSYAHVAAKMPCEPSNRNFAEYVIKKVREYWREAATSKADRDYDTYTKEM